MSRGAKRPLRQAILEGMGVEECETGFRKARSPGSAEAHGVEVLS